MSGPFVPNPALRIAGAPGGPLASLTFAAKDRGILGTRDSDAMPVAVAKAMEAG